MVTLSLARGESGLGSVLHSAVVLAVVAVIVNLYCNETSQDAKAHKNSDGQDAGASDVDCI